MHGPAEATTAIADDRLTFDGDCAEAYNEEAFRHFLGLERIRAARSGRSFLLLLVSLKKDAGAGATIAPPVARRLLSGLGECVREVDFFGWYRTGRVAGAVLAQGAPVDDAGDVAHRIRQRVAGALSRHLPDRAAACLLVRVLEVREPR